MTPQPPQRHINFFPHPCQGLILKINLTKHNIVKYLAHRDTVLDANNSIMYAKQLCKANRTVALDPYKPSARTKPELNNGRDLDRKTRLLIHIVKGDHVS